MSDQVVQRVACKAVIVRDGKVLVLREAGSYVDGTNGGKYQLPGGRIEPGEHMFDGLTRETREETGLTVAIGKPIHAGEWFPVIRGTQNHIVGIFFLCTSPDDTVRLSEEHDQFVWVSMQDVSAYDIIMPDKQAVIDALAV